MTSVDALSKPRLRSHPVVTEEGEQSARAWTSAVAGVHVVPLPLVLLVLFHSGRGGELSNMLGEGMGASVAGFTVMERNLDRITVVIAVLFSVTAVILALRLH